MADRPIGQAPKRVELAHPGAKRAAAVMLGLGAEVATEVFKQLGEAELRQVALGAKDLKRAPQEAVPEALRTFVDSMQRVGAESGASDELLRKVAVTALGSEIAHRAFDGVAAPPPVDEVLGPVAQADPEALAMVLSREQPQTIALVLSSLEPERAAAVMDLLPGPQRAQIVRRMAIVESVAPEVLREVRQALTIELQSLVAEGMRKVDGRSAALEILRRSSGAQQAEVLSQIEKDEPALANELRTKLFTFEDLTRLSDRDVQQFVKQLDVKQLTTALKGASPAVKNKFMRNMSARSAEMLADDLAVMGPVMLSVVEAAQAAVAQMAVEMAEKGRITIVRPSDKML